jgi:hypothetical protein
MDAGGLMGLYVKNIVNAGIVDGPRVKSTGRHMSQTAGHGDSPNIPLDWVKEGTPMGEGWMEESLTELKNVQEE